MIFSTNVNKQLKMLNKRSRGVWYVNSLVSLYLVVMNVHKTLAVDKDPQNRYHQIGFT